MIFNNKKKLDLIKENIPDELKQIPQWGYFHVYYDKERNKKIKRIFSAVENRVFLNLQDESTFSTFDKALEKAYEKNASGLSLVILEKNNISCVDLDHQKDETGQWSELSKELVELAGDTFIEKSFSKNGLHIFTKGSFDNEVKNRNEDLGLELYWNKKIISVTGDIFQNNSKKLLNTTESLKTKLESLLGRREIIQRVERNYNYLTYSDVIDAIEKSSKNSLFQKLYVYGDISNYQSHSQADFALLNILAFFTKCDSYLMEKIFLGSALYRPNKKINYVRTSIENAIHYCKKTYAEDREYFKQKRYEEIKNERKKNEKTKYERIM